MSEVMSVLLPFIGMAFGAYVGYKVGRVHGWKRARDDAMESGKQSKDEDVSTG